MLLADRRHALFMAGDTGALKKLHEATGSIVRAIGEIEDAAGIITSRVATVNKVATSLVEGGKPVINLPSLPSGITDAVSMVKKAHSKITTALEVLDLIGPAKTSFDEGLKYLKGIDMALDTFSDKHPVLAIYTKMYLGPVIKVCIKNLGVLAAMRKSQNRTAIGLGMPNAVSWGVEPGGEAMYYWLVGIFKKGTDTPLPDSVYEFLDAMTATSPRPFATRCRVGGSRSTDGRTGTGTSSGRRCTARRGRPPSVAPAWAEQPPPRIGARMAAPDTTDEFLDVNRRYHDVAAAEYDAKWGVDFGDVGRAQVLGKVEKLLAASPGPFARSLEIGAGTGYFTLNLMQEGVVEAAVCADVSPGMLATLRANADRLGLDPETVACDAAALPFDGRLIRPRARARGAASPAGARPLVPRVHARAAPGRRTALRRRSLPLGDRIAAVPKRAGLAAAPVWRRLVNVRAAAPDGNGHAQPVDHALEGVVDVHAFTPADLERHARGGRLSGVRVRREELLANWFGWFNRTLEATAVHGDIPWGLVPLRLPRLHRVAAEGQRRGARAAPSRPPASSTSCLRRADRAGTRVARSARTHADVLGGRIVAVPAVMYGGQ